VKKQTINLEQLRTVRDGSGHSIFGPSSSSMWLNCPGSLIPNILAPDDAGVDAAYGTVAHEVTEIWGKSGVRPSHLIGGNRFIPSGEWGYLVTIDEEMLSHCEACLDSVDFDEGERFWERRVDCSRISPIPNQSGTADLIIRQPHKLIVSDWKFGKGVPVFAERNTQGMFYALGALWEFDPDGAIQEIEIRIAQPRRDNFDSWTVSREELLIFAGWAKSRMEMAWRVGAPRVAGTKQCEFCKVRATCSANAKLQIELSEGVFENLDSPHECDADEMQAFKDRVDDDLMEFDIDVIDAGTLSIAQLSKLFPFRGTSDKWWRSVHAELLARAVDGELLTEHGFKVVESRSHRKFMGERVVAPVLKELGLQQSEFLKTELITPAAAENLLVSKKLQRRKDIPNLLGGITIKPPGKATIAPLRDRRPALVDLTGVSFDDLDSETEDEGN
jgi:hypothetical protein